MTRTVAPLLVASALVAGPLAQEAVPQFSSRVQLVEVYATVTDAKGEPVTGLRQADFEVLEDGTPQEVSAFAAGEFPLTVALGVDRSVSMAKEPLRLAKQASQAFLRELKPADRSMVVAISNEVEVVAPLSADRAALPFHTRLTFFRGLLQRCVLQDEPELRVFSGHLLQLCRYYCTVLFIYIPIIL